MFKTNFKKYISTICKTFFNENICFPVLKYAKIFKYRMLLKKGTKWENDFELIEKCLKLSKI